MALIKLKASSLINANLKLKKVARDNLENSGNYISESQRYSSVPINL